ncbi:BURP domain protein USPL1-like isoform X2 [Humulus lupulus]|uniref:BURP domain protein USPL1-like isoform X2 n=1 Tax=Humulus lupulus TaxID=3486 RepID=UPI002B416AF7|nr:BURP domain protein USPL1-like isoform X2 [Humulus lupulus]
MGLASWCLFLVLLYFSSWGGECRETKLEEQWKWNNEDYNDVKRSNYMYLRLPRELGREGNDDDRRGHGHGHGHMHMHMHVHGDGSSSSSDLELTELEQQQSIVFNLKDLKVGLTKAIYFPKKKHTAPILPRHLGDYSVPFSSKELPNILRLFSIPQGSQTAKAMEATLQTCESGGVDGETRICATSFESMLEFVRGIFGLDNFGHGLTHLTTTSYNDFSHAIFQNYTVLEDLEEITSPKMVACHVMEFPYAVYLCHSMRDWKFFKMSLRGQKGDIVNAISICHMDTSQWDPHHVSFTVLGYGPGMGPVCHFFPDQTNFLWFPSTISI